MKNGKEIRQTLYFSFAYCLIFTGYYVSNSFAAVLYPRFGFIGFALLYAFYSIGSLLAPSLDKRLGTVNSIIASAFVYFLYVVLLASGIPELYVLASALVGFFHGLINLCQGVWTSVIAETSGRPGLFHGIFFTVFNVNNVLGNALGTVFLLAGLDRRNLLWAMTSVTGLGFVLTFGIVRLQSSVQQKGSLSFGGRLMSVLHQFRIRKVLLLIPLMCQMAGSICLTFQILPILIQASGGNSPLHHVVSFLAYGIGSVVSSFVTGRLFDRGWQFVLVPLFFLEFGAMAMVIAFGFKVVDGWFYVLLGFVLGVTNFAEHVLMSSSITKYFPDTSTSVFAFYRTIYSLSYVPLAVVAGLLEFQWLVLICSIFYLFTAISFPFFVKCKMPDEYTKLLSSQENPKDESIEHIKERE